MKENAEAIADLAPNIRVLVSTWGHHSGYVAVRSMSRSMAAIKWRLAQRQSSIEERNGVIEIFRPALSWSPKLPHGGADCLIAVNRRNLEMAAKHFGPMNLIHAHVCYPAGYIASVLSRKYRIPYVLTEHSGPFPPYLSRQGRPIREIEQAFRNASATVAVSPFLAGSIASYGFREPAVIPNSVDERRFSCTKPASSKFIFFTLCLLTENKGVDQLLQAIAMWNPPRDRFEFRIGGDGPMRNTYELMAEQLGVADRVRWLGNVGRDEAPRLFQECHAFVLPSHHESFGVVYAEAIASGKPVIATRCGGPEYIVNELNGVLVDVGDVEALAAAMGNMAENWSNYEPMIIREDFLKRFSRKVVIDQLVATYYRVAKT